MEKGGRKEDGERREEKGRWIPADLFAKKSVHSTDLSHNAIVGCALPDMETSINECLAARLPRSLSAGSTSTLSMFLRCPFAA